MKFCVAYQHQLNEYEKVEIIDVNPIENIVVKEPVKIITDENVDQLMSMSYSSNYKLLLNPTSVDPTKIQGDVAVSKYADIIYNHLKEDKNKNVKLPSPPPPLNVEDTSDSLISPGKGSPIDSNDFFELPQDYSLFEESKDREQKEKELLLSDIIEELPTDTNSLPYPENVTPAFNSSENENILEFQEETPEKEETSEPGGGEDKAGEMKKIVISSESADSIKPITLK